MKYIIASIALLFLIAIAFVSILANANPDLFNPNLYGKSEVKIEKSYSESELTQEEYETLWDSRISQGVSLKK